MNHLLRSTILIIILFLVTGCAKRTNWFASPEIQMEQNPYYDAQIEPLKTDKNFFHYFQLTITNRTDEELKLSWNKTTYLRNGSPNGVFIFQGITPDDVKNLSIPDDTIPAGGTFTKRIAPYRLVAWTPLGNRPTSETRINPGIIPAGRNGINVVIMKNGKKITERLEINIEEIKAE